jgi:hypothetical protein
VVWCVRCGCARQVTQGRHIEALHGLAGTASLPNFPATPPNPQPLTPPMQAINDHVLRGDVEAAAALTEDLAPGALAAAPDVAFRLKCQKFCELVSACLCVDGGGKAAVLLFYRQRGGTF